MRLNKAFVLIFCGILGSGCLPRPNVEATAAYSRQVAMTMLRVAQMEEVLAGNQSRVEQLEEVIRVQGQHAASRLETMEEVNFEVSRLRGEIEVAKRELELLRTSLHDYQIAQESRQLRDEARLAQLETFLGLEPPKAVALESLTGDSEDGDGEVEPGTPVEKAPGADGGPLGDGETDTTSASAAGDTSTEDTTEAPAQEQTVEDRINLANEHIDAGRYAVARAVLAKAIEDNADAKEVPEMRYTVAQTYLHEENWRSAATELKAVLDNYSSSEWASWSMLRLGECFQGLGKEDSAVLFYEGVVQSYPRSDAAKEAKRRLK